VLNKFEQISSNRIKDLPWIKFHGKDYQIGRWTYGISCWYRDTYGADSQGTPAVTAHILSKLIPELFEEYGENLEKLADEIGELSNGDIEALDEQIAYAIQLSTEPLSIKKKPNHRMMPLKAWTLFIALSSTLFLAGMGLAFLISS
jgi:hypothetical protein